MPCSTALPYEPGLQHGITLRAWSAAGDFPTHQSFSQQTHQHTHWQSRYYLLVAGSRHRRLHTMCVQDTLVDTHPHAFTHPQDGKSPSMHSDAGASCMHLVQICATPGCQTTHRQSWQPANAAWLHAIATSTVHTRTPVCVHSALQHCVNSARTHQYKSTSRALVLLHASPCTLSVWETWPIRPSVNWPRLMRVCSSICEPLLHTTPAKLSGWPAQGNPTATASYPLSAIN